ncbi:MAG: hypothetical protein CML33_01605 [Rhodobacteraceae bacterium]|nr:hypothetical protein [Paracoccaceae bacterium]
MNLLDDVQSRFDTYALYDEVCLPPLWEFHGRFRSLWKYWLLSRDLFGPLVADAEREVEAAMHGDMQSDVILDAGSLVTLEADEADLYFIPDLQRALIIVAALALVETLMREVCKEIDPSLPLNDRGSYVQRYNHFLKKRAGITVAKEHLRAFENFGHLRNSFVHQLNYEVPVQTTEDINQMTGPFSDISEGVGSTHVELCLRLLNEFGENFQRQYLAHINR